MAQDWGPTFFSNIPADPGRHVCRFCIGMYVDHGFLTHECPDCGAPVPTKAESLYLHVWSRFNNVDRLVRELGLSWSALPRALQVEMDDVAYLARKSYLARNGGHHELCQIYFERIRGPFGHEDISSCIDAVHFFETEVLGIAITLARDRDSEDSETESERAYSETGDTDSDTCFTASERAAFKAECSGRKHGTCAKMCCEACTRDPHA